MIAYQNYDALKGILIYVLISFPVIVVMSIVLYFLSRESLHPLIISLPSIYTVLALTTLPIAQKIVSQVRDSYLATIEDSINKYRATIKADFISTKYFSIHGNLDFITTDDQGHFYYITNGNDHFLRASPIGTLRGNTLEMLYSYSLFGKSNENIDDEKNEIMYRKIFESCIDKNGKSLFDYYEVKYQPNQNLEDFNLEPFNKYRDKKWMEVDNLVGEYEVYRIDYKSVLVTGKSKNK